MIKHGFWILDEFLFFFLNLLVYLSGWLFIHSLMIIDENTSERYGCFPWQQSSFEIYFCR